MAKTTEEDGGGAELGMRTSSYSNAVTDDTAPPSAAGKPEHSMTFSSHPELKELDTVGDGTIDEVDLLRLLKLKHHEENIIREQRYGLLCLIVVIIGVGKYPRNTCSLFFSFSLPKSLLCAYAVELYIMIETRQLVVVVSNFA